jgi:hypothetical protein
MEKINNYIYDNNNYKELDGNDFDINLPISKVSGQDYIGLLKINEIYILQLTKIFSGNNRYKKNILPYNDMIVINSLLKENLRYLYMLLQYQNLQFEFEELYNKCIQILNLLEKTDDNKISIFQKLFRIKYLKLRFQLLKIGGRDFDLANSDNLLEEIEKIYYEPIIKNYITDLDISSIKLDRAFIKFCICDFYLAKEYALDSLEILNKYDIFKMDKKENNENKEQYIKKQVQIYEFLAQIYDMEKDYQNCLTCYEKSYYLYLGIYNINHPIFAELKSKMEAYKNIVKNMNSELKMKEEEDMFIQKFNEGIISNFKGTADSFSFNIPVTNIVEPLLISIYALPKFKYIDLDYFSKDLFLKNIYLDKAKLFPYLGYDKKAQNENYILYTDDALNYLLQKVVVIHNKYIYFTDPTLYSISINI